MHTIHAPRWSGIIRSRYLVPLVLIALLAALFGSGAIQRADAAPVSCTTDLAGAITAAGTTPTTISMAPAGCTYTVGGSPLTIASGAAITIVGNGATITGATNGAFSVAAGATLDLSDITLSGNSARSGGAIFNQGALSISDSTLSGNSATSGGGAIESIAGTVSITDSTLSGNSALEGGGISSGRSSGAIRITDSTLSENSASSRGGAIYNSSFGTVTIAGSAFYGNSARLGGAIDQFGVQAVVTITDSTLSNNSAIEIGGAVADGGAVANFTGTVSISGSTLSGNSTADDGGAVYNADAGALTLTDSTLSGNSASSGIGGAIDNDNSALTLAANIFAGSGPGACANTSSTVTDNGYNVSDDSTCLNSGTGDVLDATTADIIAAGTTLAHNGGPTETLAITSSSVAYGIIPAADCPLTDQRGYYRLADGDPTSCDAGAYEADASALIISGSQTYDSDTPSFTTTTLPPDVTGTVTCTGLTDNGGTAISSTLPTGQYTIDPATCSGLTVTGQPDAVINYTGGTYTVNPAPLTITASDIEFTYGGTVPAVTASYSGLVGGDTAPATPPTCTTTVTSLSPAGTYPGADTCSGAADSNYIITYVAGSATVDRAGTSTRASASFFNYSTGPLVAISATVVANSPSSAVVGEGAVTFSNGTTILCTVPVSSSGHAECEAAISPSSVPPHSLTVIYSDPDGNFVGSQTTTDIVSQLASPTIVDVQAASPPTGAAWEVTGGGFSGATDVTVCGVNVPFTVINDNTILVGTPANSGPGQCTIVVTAAGGTVSSGTVTIVPAALPGAPVNVGPTGSSTPTAGTCVTVTLSGTWTLIGWPGAAISPAVALSGDGSSCANDVTSQVSVIWGWDAVNKTWQAYFPVVDVPGANDLTTMTPGAGYFVGLANPAAGAIRWDVADGS